MRIETTRFGWIDVDPDRLVTLPEGLLGFPERQKFTLIQSQAGGVFLWLQSVEDPALAFVVCEPRAFVSDYEADVRAEERAALGMQDDEEALVLVIVNKVGENLTANLLGPLVLGLGTLRGKQVIVADRRYGTRHVLMPARVTPQPVVRSA